MDNRTLLICNLCMMVFFSLSVLVVHFSSGCKRYSWWLSLGYVCLSAGIVLTALRTQVPVWAWGNLANALLVSGFLAFLASLYEYKSKHVSWTILGLVLLVHSIVYMTCTQIWDSPTGRIVSGSVVGMGACLCLAWELMDLGSRMKSRAPLRILQGSLVGFALSNGIRLVSSVMERASSDIYEGPVMSGYLLVTMIIMALITFALFFAGTQILAFRIDEEHQNLKDLNASKERLLSVMGHDLVGGMGTLNQMAYYISGAIGVEKPEEIQPAADSMVKGTESMLRIVKGLLDWSSRLRRQSAEEAIISSPAQIMASVVSMAENEAKAKGLAILATKAPEIHCQLYQESLLTILRNLVVNAIKFTPPGGEVVLSCVLEDSLLVFDVADTGIGMAPGRVDAFNAGGVPGSTKGLGGEAGYGMGLILCRELLASFGGSMQIAESRPGTGTLFQVRVPCVMSGKPVQPLSGRDSPWVVDQQT